MPSWTPLATRLPNAPLILAGPMLRKVTRDSVTVWLALKASARVTLTLFASDAPGATPLFSGSRDTVQIGPHLHIVAVTARRGAAAMLNAGTVYFYDLSFLSALGPMDLAGAVGSPGRTVFAYGTHRLPGFSLPPADINHVRLVQGSCRKPNADGPDALATLDDMIEASFDSANSRPHQLILGGDQIYADEVADVLLLMLSDAAREMVGGESHSHGSPTTRTRAVKSAGFTSEDTRSHLMSLGEYLAMHLFVWSPVLWPEAIPTVTQVESVVWNFSIEEDRTNFPKVRKSAEAQAINVTRFAATLGKVRRALANVPTYMIFDDHEVTDDWNMTREFCENVYGSDLGTRIITNGLIAYTLCQHWGNAPEQFETSPLMPFNAPAGVGFLSSFASRLTNEAGFYEGMRRCVGIHTVAQMTARSPFAAFHDVGIRVQGPDGWLDSESLIFHYTIEAAAYQVVMTDSRTWRSFPRAGRRSPPDLIPPSQLPVQITATPPLGDRLLLVLFTTNFPPGPALRQGGRDVPTLSPSHAYADFYDAWEVERGVFGHVLAELSRKFPRDGNQVHSGALVVLSGDVHASSASRLHYVAQSQTGDAPTSPTKADLVIAQLVASSFHNLDYKTVGQHKRGYEYIPDMLAAKLVKQRILRTEHFLGWNPNITPTGTIIGSEEQFIADPSSPGPALSKGLLRFDPDRPIATLRRQTLSAYISWQLVEVDREPSFRLRLDYLKADFGGHYDDEPRLVDTRTAMTRRGSSMRAYERYASLVCSGREMIGLNNITEIGFTFIPGSQPEKVVHHTVHWKEKDENQLVRFDISLDSTNDMVKYPGEQ